MSLASQLVAHRRHHGLSQEQLAELSGLSPRTIGEIETGRTRRPHPRTLTALAEVLELGPTEKASLFSVARKGRPFSVVADPRSAAVPRLPGPAAGFSGRDCELSEIAATSRSGGVVLLHGMPGVGKTTTALRAGHMLAERFPDGQVFVNLADSVSVPGGVLAALGVGGGEDVEPQRSSWYRAALRHKRLLLVVDGITSEDQVAGWLPRRPGCLTVLTSRHALLGLDDVVRIRLTTLPSPAALDLLASIAGEARISAERSAAAEVVDLCGELPLALRIAGNRLTSRPRWPITYLADRLRGDPLATLVAGDLGIGAVFESAHRQLGRALQEAFRHFAGAGALQDSSALDGLVTAGLLERDDTGHHMHRLLVTYAQRLSRPEGNSGDTGDIR